MISFACQLQVTYQLSKVSHLILQPPFYCPIPFALPFFNVDFISFAFAEKLLLCLLDATFDGRDACLYDIEGGCERVKLRLHLDVDGIADLLYTLGILLPDF